MTPDHQALTRRCTAKVAAAFCAGNPIPPHRLAPLLDSVHAAFVAVQVPPEPPAPTKPVPAVPVSRSVREDYIVCLEDGQRLKTLKRYLRSRYGMTPDEYRRKWGLPKDYPMVAPAFSLHRSLVAKSTGLGRTPHQRNGAR